MSAPVRLPRTPRLPRHVDRLCGWIATGVIGVLLASTVSSSAADGDRLRPGGAQRTGIASIAPSLSAIGSTGPFRFSGTTVAPRLQAAAWYNHLGHFSARPERVAAFETQTAAAAQVASADVPPAPAGQLIANAAKPVGASLGAIPGATPAEVALAYADPSPKAEGGALAAINAAASVQPEEGEPDDLDALLVPDVPLPLPRPEPPVAAEPAKKANTKQADKPGPAEKPEAEQQANKPARPSPKAVALSRPNIQGEQEDSSPGFLKRMFTSKPRAGNGVAVYDISAAKVYMPDGSVLEAASGIGKMANNPKYAHVKMNGPTPPHTYNLRMREKRFHGVEAIRMLPVDGKNKFGRDGFLAHTQLLRGRPGQSHGCVAFKDYNKFLRAFKQGKVKQMIVVSGGGAAVFARTAGKDNDV